MTTYDYLVTMKDVRIADLKARLSEHLRYVKRGESLTVLDRDTPVARIVPVHAVTSLKVREPLVTGRLQDVRLPAPVRLKGDVLELLAEERGER